jgi:hypothetical protein
MGADLQQIHSALPCELVLAESLHHLKRVVVLLVLRVQHHLDDLLEHVHEPLVRRDGEVQDVLHD